MVALDKSLAAARGIVSTAARRTSLKGPWWIACLVSLIVYYWSMMKDCGDNDEQGRWRIHHVMVHCIIIPIYLPVYFIKMILRP